MSRGVKPSFCAKRNAIHRASTMSALRLLDLICSAVTPHTEAVFSTIRLKIWFLFILFVLLQSSDIAKRYNLSRFGVYKQGARTPIGLLCPCRDVRASLSYLGGQRFKYGGKGFFLPIAVCSDLKEAYKGSIKVKRHLSSLPRYLGVGVLYYANFALFKP